MGAFLYVNKIKVNIINLFYASVEVPDEMEKEDVSLKMKTSFDIEEPLLYDSFSTGFVWGVATSAYQVSALTLIGMRQGGFTSL